MPTMPNPVTGLPLSGGTITGALTVNGLLAEGAGTIANSAGPANQTPANANGVSAQLTDLTHDYMVYLTVGTAGTALTVKMGPTSGVAVTVYNAATATAGQTIAFRLPAGWFWQWAAVTATLAEQLAVGC